MEITILHYLTEVFQWGPNSVLWWMHATPIDFSVICLHRWGQTSAINMCNVLQDRWMKVAAEWRNSCIFITTKRKILQWLSRIRRRDSLVAFRYSQQYWQRIIYMWTYCIVLVMAFTIKTSYAHLTFIVLLSFFHGLKCGYDSGLFEEEWWETEKKREENRCIKRTKGQNFGEDREWCGTEEGRLSVRDSLGCQFQRERLFIV